MRFMGAVLIGLAGAAGTTPAASAGLSTIDAMNRCESFVFMAVRPELGPDLTTPYKITCYFGLIDPQIDSDTNAVCARISMALAEPHRAVAEFICLGAYETHRRESEASS